MSHYSRLTSLPTDKLFRSGTVGVFLCFIVLAGPIACKPTTSPSNQAAGAVGVGETFGPISLTPLGYETPGLVPPKQILETLPNQVTLLHFWGTWCPPCRAEYPELAEAVERFGDELAFLSVSCEGGPNQSYQDIGEQTSEFFSQHNLSSIAYGDLDQQTRRSFIAATRRPDLFYPTSVLIDQDKKILAIWEGFSPENVPQMKVAIEQAIEASSTQKSPAAG